MRLSLSQKIGGGYFLSLGITTIGIILGFTIGDYHAQEAGKSREYTLEEIRLLNRLENQLLQIRTYQYQFIFLVDKPKLFKQKEADFSQNQAKIKKIWLELEEFVNRKIFLKNLNNNNILLHLIREDQFVNKLYLQQTNDLLSQVYKLTSKQKSKDGKTLLLNFNNNSTVKIKMDHSVNNLNALIDLVYQQNKNAEIVLNYSEEIRSQIIALSILLSVIIATILALFTTHAITRPIVNLTDVAHQVVAENNYNLQIPTSSTDEVGVLASSFNQLIQWVSHYIAELEEARQALEVRVQERTEELAHRNYELQQARQDLEVRVQERTEELAHRNYELQQAHDQLNQTLESLKSSQSQLIQSEKMSSLGQMVAGIAHEVNNPISFIYGNLKHIEEYVSELLNLVKFYQQQNHQPTDIIQAYHDHIDLEFLLKDLPTMLASMKMGVERIRNLVLSLRNFSRLDESEVKAVNIHEGIDSTLLILSHRIKQGITINKQYNKLPLIKCYPAQLNQVFMNIINNSIDELLSSRQKSPGEIVIQTQVVNDQEISITIRDNGSGIPPEIIHKIFDPFFTTKPVGQGTGLGLAISYQIIEKHQGTIQVKSGQGVEFIITIPIYR